MNREQERKRLVEFIKDSLKKHIGKSCLLAENITSDLLDNGIVVPPVKVGQTVFVVSRYYVGDWEIYQCEVDAITIYDKNTFISCVAKDVRFGKINFGLNISEFGKTVFASREEAEKALERKEDEG